MKMDRKFYTDEFEDLIKESADDFKMYPSKKVWQGLYNDLHPGRRWPSLVVTFAFIFGLLTISHLNTHQLRQPNIDPAIMAYPQTNSSGANSSGANPILTSSSFKQNETVSMQQPPKTISPVKSSIQNLSFYDFEDDVQITALTQIANGNSYKTPVNTANIVINASSLKSIYSNGNQPDLKLSQSLRSPEYLINYIDNLPNILFINAGLLSKTSANLEVVTTVETQQTVDVAAPKAAIKKLKTSKVRWMYSISPTVSYRKYTSAEALNANIVLSGLMNALPGYDVNRKFSQHASSGLETGVTMKYPLNKHLKFTSGFQLNYSSYIIQANTIHPMMATLLLQNQTTGMPYAYSSISYYGNGPGVAPVNLRNYAVNVSVPVGLEYQVGGDERVKFYVAATVQPVLALASRSYLLSTDNKNYLTNPDMARHINMATNFGAFMSVNSKKINWQLGPQVNYQLLSSYTDVYPVKEHYANYGIKLAFGRR